MNPTSPDPMPAPDDETAQIALARAKTLYGRSARVVDSPELAERVAGKRFQIGIVRTVVRQKKGFRPMESHVFVALGRGNTWAEAFEDAEKFRKELSGAMGNAAVDDANRVYPKSLKVSGKMKRQASRG